MNSWIYKFFLLFFCFSSLSNAKEDGVDRIIFQHAGEIGTYVAGFGFDINSIYEIALLYGHVPSSQSLSEVDTLAVKNNFNLYTKKKYKFHTGIAIYHALNSQYKTYLNDDYPDSYYQIGSIRGLIYLGGQYILSRKYSVFYEVGLNDLQIVDMYNNSTEELNNDSLSAAIGMNFMI